MLPLFLDRIPTPSLRNYVLGSFIGLASMALFAWSHAPDFMMEALNSTKNMTDNEMDLLFNKLDFAEYWECLLLAITSQFWTLLVR